MDEHWAFPNVIPSHLATNSAICLGRPYPPPRIEDCSVIPCAPTASYLLESFSAKEGFIFQVASWISMESIPPSLSFKSFSQCPSVYQAGAVMI